MNNHTICIEIEQLRLVNSTLKSAKRNLKKLEKIMVDLDAIDYKKLKLDNEIFLTTIYYEVWFIFINELISVQKQLIEGQFKPQSSPCKEIVDQISLLLKPISTQILSFRPPQIKLCVPQHIYNEF